MYAVLIFIVRSMFPVYLIIPNLIIVTIFEG
jgi:hypothetical protein